MGAASKVKPTHKAVKSYYAALEAYADQSVEHEGAQALDQSPRSFRQDRNAADG